MKAVLCHLTKLTDNVDVPDVFWFCHWTAGQQGLSTGDTGAQQILVIDTQERIYIFLFFFTKELADYSPFHTAWKEHTVSLFIIIIIIV